MQRAAHRPTRRPSWRYRSSFLLVVVAGLLVGASLASASTTYSEHQKLTASDSHANQRFGQSVAISGDVAAVGAPYDDDRGSDAGAVYVFRRSGDAWIEEAKVTASDGARSEGFGAFLAVDGDTIAVTSQAAQNGAVYVFRYVTGEWREEAKLLASDAQPLDCFGCSLAVSGDTLAIGASGQGDAGLNSGAAYVFSRIDDTWVEVAKLTASDAEPLAYFGSAIALTPDMLAVGAGSDGDDGIDDPGAVYVFTRIGSDWVESDKLTASDGAPLDEFGLAIAVAGDLMVVGSPRHGAERGAAYVFDRVGGAWVETAKLTSPHGDLLGFGVSVGVSDAFIVVGSIAGIGPEAVSGAHAYAKEEGHWTHLARLEASDGEHRDTFGIAVGQDSSNVVVGAPGDSDFGTSTGSAYLFDLSEPVIVQRPPTVDADFAHGETFPSGVVQLQGTVADDAAVNWVRVAIRDRITRLWLQDDGESWGSFNRFDAVLADPDAAETTWSFELALPDGTYALSARTKDAAGLVGHIKPWRRFNIGDDFTAPFVDADIPAGAVLGSPLTISGTAGDDQAIVRVRVAIRDRSTGLWLQDDQVTWGSFSRFVAELSDPEGATTVWTFEVVLPEGEYRLSVRATDRLGNETSIRPWRAFSIY